MNILGKNWLTESPFDYELKRYKLLGAVKKLNAMIEAGHLYSSLIEIENQLDDLYKLKHGKSDIDNRTRVLKGINLDTMSLEYEYPEDNESIAHVYMLVDMAIQYFEDLFKLVRNKWRTYSTKINISEIPSTRPTKSKGYVFVSNKKDKDSNIITYSYNKPSKFNGEWKDLKLSRIETEINNLTDLSNFIEKVDSESSDFRFWRCTYTIEQDYDDCVFPLINYNLFYKINIS